MTEQGRNAWLRVLLLLEGYNCNRIDSGAGVDGSGHPFLLQLVPDSSEGVYKYYYTNINTSSVILPLTLTKIKIIRTHAPHLGTTKNQ